MRAGELDRQVVLERRSTQADAATRQPVERFSSYATVWASVSPSRGARDASSTGVEQSADFDVRIRWRKDVDATDRVLIDDRPYYLVGPPLMIGRREGLTLRVVGRAEAAYAEPGA